jgi:putative glutamine amidotransferase
MKPLIGLNLDVNVAKPGELRIVRTYCAAIEKAGAVPVLLPPMSDAALRRALAGVDAVVLIGGRDYSPELYGETESAPIAPLHPDRQDFDMRLAKMALKQSRSPKRAGAPKRARSSKRTGAPKSVGMPSLWICGGLQALNIALGGTLVQDIAQQFPESKVLHRGEDSSVRHPVSIVENSQLAKIYGATELASIVSSHHQAIAKLGRKLRVVATASDGIIEAVELQGRDWVIGVQWHPERSLDVDIKLFRALVKQARAYAESK